MGVFAEKKENIAQRGARVDNQATMIIIQILQTVEEYIETEKDPEYRVEMPKQCPTCQGLDRLIRWGKYVRQVWTGEEKYELEIQRVKCKGCGKTHALLPDFLHPYRRYTLEVMQQIIWMYVLWGMGFGQIMKKILSEGPTRRTVREWVSSFGYGAGYLLLDVMRQFVMKLYPESEVRGRAPQELERSSQAEEWKRS